MLAERQGGRVFIRMSALCIAMAGIGVFASTKANATGKPVYTTFDVGAVVTVPTGLNSNGEITGWYQDDYLHVGGFVRNADGVVTKFGVAGASLVQPYDINPDGVVVGGYDAGGDPPIYHGFFRNPDGTIATVDVPGAVGGSWVMSVNAAGVMTGFWLDEAGAYHGFVRSTDGQFSTVDVPGADDTYVAKINNGGIIAGSYQVSQQLKGFTWNPDGSFTTFEAIAGAKATLVTTMNGSGTVAGTVTDANGEGWGFVRTSNGAVTVFDGGVPESINRNGVITGWTGVKNHKHHTRGFIRTPDGALQVFKVPGSRDLTDGAAINGSGVIVGQWAVHAHDCCAHAFVRTP